MEPQKFSAVQYFIKSTNTCKRGPVLKMHHFKILWIDQNKGVNHINFLILWNFLLTMKYTKFISLENFQLYSIIQRIKLF